MKKRAILIVGLALMVAAAGVVYAHWTDTLKVNATVNTGTVNVMWQFAGTDDDGLDNTGFVINGNAYSNSDNGMDPAEVWRCHSTDNPVCGYKLGPDLGLTRYDQNVASCTVSASADSKTLTATIANAYPSYHCTIFSQMSNEGSVPVKATAFRLTTPVGGTLKYAGTEYVEGAAGNTAWCNQAENAGKCPSGIFVGDVPVITFDFADGTSCSNQLDPYVPGGDMDQNAVWFHVEEAAAQNASYTFSWQYDFVNWNEWDPSMCTVTINGHTYP
jgi:predicted ribosomally synthesized peptide with SipW-like signal peptide